MLPVGEAVKAAAWAGLFRVLRWTLAIILVGGAVGFVVCR